MAKWGTKVVRIPTGYWNWIDLGDDVPDVPEEHVQRYKNLQNVKPSEYKKYIDMHFDFARQTGMKILPTLHGAPGSQNSATHSGCILGKHRKGVKYIPEHYFYKEKNIQLAL